MTLHTPKNTLTQIDAVWMVVSVDPTDNTEGVCAAHIRGQWVTLIAADEARLPFIREQGKRLALAGQKCRLIKLSTREVVEEL